MTLSHFGFEHIPGGPGSPVLLVYGEETYDTVCGGGLGLYGYHTVALGDAAGGDDAALAVLFRKLAARAVVIWADTEDEGFAHARRHAGLLAAASAAAVGIVFTPESYTYEDARDCADTALREALARALPTQGAKAARAVGLWLLELDAGAVFAHLRGVLARHLTEPASTLDALALWSLHAWFVRAGEDTGTAFDVSPRLVLSATDARADHARALRLLAWLTPSPLVVARTLAAHLVRPLETERPTLLLDDVGGGLLYRRDMRTLIAAGASRDGLFLGTPSKRNPTGRAACFAPAAIATTAQLPDDLRVRAIVVSMQPAPVGRVRGALGAVPEDVLTLRAQMQAFAARTVLQPEAAQALMPRAFGAAARENWAPLFAIAAALGSRLALRAVAAAEALQALEPAPASNLALLADIRALVRLDGGGVGVSTVEMIERLSADPERPWASVRRGRKIDARALAERMRAFGVRPVTMRIGDDAFARGYRVRDLTEAFDRYLGFVSDACDVTVTAA